MLTVYGMIRRESSSCQGCRFSFSLRSTRCWTDLSHEPVAHRANMIFIPVMASRLMLSLKKAIAEPEKQWSLGTLTGRRAGTSARDGTIRFAPLSRSEPQGVSQTCAVPKEGDIELDAVLRMPLDRGSRDIAC